MPGERESVSIVAIEEELRDHAERLRAWNYPDDEHTRYQLRSIVESVIADVVPVGEQPGSTEE